MTRLLLFCLMFFCDKLTSAQFYKLHGRITNTLNEPLAFASIKLKDSPRGVVSKENGSYELSLNPGYYEIAVSMTGYKPQLIKVAITKADYKLDILLEPDKTELKEVTIKSRIRDRSEEIIRQVIRHKEINQSAAGNYSATAYIKAVQEDSATKFKRRKKLLADTAKVNADLRRMTMTEISLKFDQSAEGKIKEERMGVTRRGDASGLFYLSLTEGKFDFYNNLVTVPSISPTPFLSPVSYSGLVAYKYRLLQIDTTHLKKRYRIQVKPTKISNATVEGELIIEDSSWAILHTRFTLPSYHLPEYDFFELEQQYDLVNNTAWMVTRQQFHYFSKTNKAKKSGSTLVIFDSFQLNKKFEKKHFGTELSKAAEEAYKRDSSFWLQVRTEPLTEKEIRFIRYRDSIYNATHTKAYLDSIDRVINKVTWKKIVFTGQSIYDRPIERTWRLPPLVSLYQPFQFGGARISPFIFYNRTYPSRKWVSLYAKVSYGFRNKDFNGNIRYLKMFNPFSRATYRIEAGRDFQYIFSGDAWINMLKRSNQYLSNYGGIGFNRELINGLFIYTDADIAFRRSLSGYKTNPDVDSLFGDILENNQAIAFNSYNAFYGKLELRYTPFQRYMREPKEKVILGSSWPTAYVQWRKGIPGIFNSEVNFDYLELGLQQTLKLGLLGISSYTLRSGSFLSKKDLRLVDYKYQRQGDPLLFLNPNEAFQSLDSSFAVFKRFYEAHYVHEFNGAILNKIPLLKNLELREIAGGGFLFAKERNLRYAEVLAGVERAFRAPFNIPTRFKLGVYVVGSVANQFKNPIQFKIGITTWDQVKNKWN